MVEMFPALGGDCTLITFEEIDYRILIDGGFKDTFVHFLAPRLKSLGAAGKGIDLLVVTHVDNDHIIGIIELFRKLNNRKMEIEIREIWYNSYRHLFSGNKETISATQEKRVADEVRKMKTSQTKECQGKEIGYSQGETLAKLLTGKWENVWNGMFGGKAVCCGDTAGTERELRYPWLSATLLNPSPLELHDLEIKWNIFRRTKCLPMENGDSVLYEDCFERFLTYADSSVTNQSSIALLLRYTDSTGREYRLLFLGDASAENCLKRLQNWEFIRFDCVKLPHHGSKNNIIQDTLKLLQVDNLLFSSDGQRHGHPDWEVVSAAACAEKCETMLFNYDSVTAERVRHEFPKKRIISGIEGYCKLTI